MKGFYILKRPEGKPIGRPKLVSRDVPFDREDLEFKVKLSRPRGANAGLISDDSDRHYEKRSMGSSHIKANYVTYAVQYYKISQKPAVSS
ncbi:MAG: hypothetical protein WCK29_00930 [archaeon]